MAKQINLDEIIDQVLEELKEKLEARKVKSPEPKYTTPKNIRDYIIAIETDVIRENKWRYAPEAYEQRKPIYEDICALPKRRAEGVLHNILKGRGVLLGYHADLVNKRRILWRKETERLEDYIKKWKKSLVEKDRAIFDAIKIRADLRKEFIAQNKGVFENVEPEVNISAPALIFENTTSKISRPPETRNRIVVHLYMTLFDRKTCQFVISRPKADELIENIMQHFIDESPDKADKDNLRGIIKSYFRKHSIICKTS